MEWLSDIHDNLGLCEEFESLRKIQRLKAEVFGEMSEGEMSEGEMSEGEMSEEAQRAWETKKKLVEEGKSDLFKEEFKGVTKADFVQALKWLELDPMERREYRGQ